MHVAMATTRYLLGIHEMHDADNGIFLLPSSLPPPQKTPVTQVCISLKKKFVTLCSTPSNERFVVNFGWKIATLRRFRV